MQSDPRLRSVLRRLVLQSFPRLRRLAIAVGWAASDELLYCTVDAGHWTIRVNDVLAGAPRRVLEGGLAHELCHVEADLHLGASQLQRAWDCYAESRWFRIREERATERRVIELGYGAELLAFIRFAHRLGYSFSREDGLLYAEIASALKQRATNEAAGRFRRRPAV